MAKKRIPLHPGAFIKGVYIDEGGVSAACIAEGLGINKGTFSRILRGQSNVTPAMALKLSAVLGRSAASWMLMQQAHSLAKAERAVAAAKWQPALRLIDGEMQPIPRPAGKPDSAPGRADIDA